MKYHRSTLAIDNSLRLEHAIARENQERGLPWEGKQRREGSLFKTSSCPREHRNRPLVIRRDKSLRMALPWPLSFGGQKYSTCSPFSHQWPGHSPFQGGVHDMTTKRSERQPSLYPSLALCRCHVPVIPPMRDHFGDKLPVGRHQPLPMFANSPVLHVAWAERDALPISFKERRSMVGTP